MPSGAFLQRQIGSGAYQPLDKKRLPNLANLDTHIMSEVALNDPGNNYGVVYAWGSYGIGYNKEKLAKILPNVVPTSLSLVLDPSTAAKLVPCGVNVVDDPPGVVRLVLKYLGRDPNAVNEKNLADVEAVLTKIRPYIRTINSSTYIEALANGDICVALGYNGDMVQARKRAVEAKNGATINFVLPLEGSLLWFDMLAIPKDAPHVANAHLFINYLMNPEVMARITNFIGFANANAAAFPLIDPAIAADPAIYPPVDQRSRSSLVWSILPSHAAPSPVCGSGSRPVSEDVPLSFAIGGSAEAIESA